MLFAKQVLRINDDLYVVKKVLREEYCKDVEILKQFYLTDTVFKKENLMYFCEKVIDLEPEPELEQEQKQITE